MRILCVSYRDWALKIYQSLVQYSQHEVLIINSYEDYSEKQVFELDPDVILFYGWSWIVAKEIIHNFQCIMLHPSPLPKYRGGSPIQNQIIAGETKSAVTLFFMTNKMDDGDIILQKEISLNGHLDEIFHRITAVGIELTVKFINSEYKLIKQNEAEATYCKRRKHSDSEITIEELQTKSSKYLFNKVRMLEDPYPNAYIKTIDGKKLLLKIVDLSNE